MYMTKETTFQITVWKEGKHYVAQCLNIDVSSFGKTKATAIKNLTEALDLYFDDKKFIKITKVERPTIESLSIKHA